MFVITTSCPNFSFQKFPFDTMECSIVMNPYESVNEMTYAVSRFVIDSSAIESFVGKTEIWNLIPGSLTISQSNVSQFEGWEVFNFELSIRFQRRHQYYIAHIFVPQAGLFVLQFCGLILPPDKVERPAFSMTVVLAYFFILDMIFSQIPKTTETVYVVVMTVVKLYTGIFLTIYMLVTNAYATNDRLGRRMRRIDKITCSITILVSLTVDFVLFYLMLS